MESTELKGVIRFEQKPRMKILIDKSRDLRAKATTEFGKPLFKKLNLSLYGHNLKTIGEIGKE